MHEYDTSQKYDAFFFLLFAILFNITLSTIRQFKDLNLNW